MCDTEILCSQLISKNLLAIEAFFYAVAVIIVIVVIVWLFRYILSFIIN